MEGNERAHHVLFCPNRIAYESCRVLWAWTGLSDPSLFTFVLTRIVYQYSRVFCTRKEMSEPSLLTFFLTEVITSLVGCFRHGRD